MAMSWCVVRRAASMAARWARAPLAPASSYSRLCFLPFSTSPSDGPENSDKSPNSKPTASGACDKDRSSSHKVSREDGAFYHNIGGKIHQEIASYSNEVAPVPNGFPFELLAFPGGHTISMERIYQKEKIQIHAPTNIEDGSSLPLTVVLIKGGLCVESHITAKPDQLHIRKVILSNNDCNMTDFGEYFKSLGITSKTLSFLYDRLGNSRKNACSQLHGVPFDFIKEHPQSGVIFLRRKTDDEIVNILAMPMSLLTYDDLEESLDFVYNDSAVYDDFDFDDVCDKMEADEEDFESIEEEVDGEDSELSGEEVDGEGSESGREEVDGEDSELSEDEVDGEDGESDQEKVDGDDSELSEEEVGVYSELSEEEVTNSESLGEEVDGESSESCEEDVDGVPVLRLLVKIQYGINLDRCLEFVGSAYPNCDHISISAISFRKARKRGEPVGLNHLDEFEDFFRKRGIEPGNFNFLFNYIPKLNQKNGCASIGMHA